MDAVTEADINSNASPNMTDVATTWAGWAVGAVASKFYKSSSSKATEGSATGVGQTAASSNNRTTGSDSLASKQEDAPSDDSNWDSSQWGDMNVRFCT